jgi:hypothetical protein
MTVACLTVAWIALTGPGCQAAQALAQPGAAAQSPQAAPPDAVIERWEQRWTLEPDGTLRRREHKKIRMVTTRLERLLGDPRLDHCTGTDELIIHTARTIRPDGTVQPVPEYAINLVGPDDVAGWPAYRDWRQTVVSAVGIEPDAVVELDYEVVTRAGMVAWLEADLNLQAAQPITERIVSVTLPEGLPLHYRLDRAQPVAAPAEGATGQYVWRFTNLPAVPSESQSPPWKESCGRLRFTICPSAGAWTAAHLTRVEQASMPDKAIQAFVTKAAKEETEPRARLVAVVKKLRDTFNLVNSPKTIRDLSCRSASEVFATNYGNPLEAGALFAAAMHALGHTPTVYLAVSTPAWDVALPTASDLAGVIVSIDLPDGTVYVHPGHGVFRNPGTWGGHALLQVDPAGQVRSLPLLGRGEADGSELHVSGTIDLDAEGSATGELRVRLTGAFYDPDSLDSADSQSKRLKGILDGVLSGFEIRKHSVTALSADVFQATVSVASKEPLQSLGTNRVLPLGSGPASLADFPMPLDRSDRRNDVRLAGRFRESVDLTIKLPKAWSATVLPATMPAAAGDWGRAEQIVEETDGSVRFHRTIEVRQDTLSPAVFAGLRDAMNTLRTDAARLLLYAPAP